MITSTEAVDTLMTACLGSYKEHAYNTTVREFEPSRSKDVPGFRNEQLFNQVPAPYVPHEWINK
jgi:hypothetical protein